MPKREPFVSILQAALPCCPALVTTSRVLCPSKTPIIPRFDHTTNGKGVHFEEFNQLLGKYSGDDEYKGSYEEMGRLIMRTPGCNFPTTVVDVIACRLNLGGNVLNSVIVVIPSHSKTENESPIEPPICDRRGLRTSMTRGLLSTTPTGIRGGTDSNALLDKPSYQKYVLFMLVLGYVFNVMDRGVLGVVLPSIKQEIQASNFQMGLLGGAVFAAFYSVMGVPIARAADRWSRVNLLALSIGLWSLATAACGLAWSYLSLFVSRAATAVGEAGGSPPSHSLISDYFPLSKRGTALAVYAISVPLGTSIGNYLSGWFNVWYGWRWTFVLLGLPGLIVAAFVWLTIKEAPRGYTDGPRAKVRAAAPPLFEVFKFLLSRNSFMHMSVAAALHALVWYSGVTWNSSFFVWSHGFNTGQAGSYLAVFSLIGAIGSFTGGYLADRLSTRMNDQRWYMWVPGIACVAMVPFQFAAYLSPDLAIVVPITFSTMFLLASMFFGPSYAVAQSVATVHMRAVSASVLLFIQTIIGLTLGPAIVGKITDVIEPTVGREHALAYTMAAVGVVNLWAALHYFLGARRYREDLAETAKLNVEARA